MTMRFHGTRALALAAVALCCLSSSLIGHAAAQGEPVNLNLVPSDLYKQFKLPNYMYSYTGMNTKLSAGSPPIVDANVRVVLWQQYNFSLSLSPLGCVLGFCLH